MCIMIINKVIPKAFRGSMSEKATATKENFANVEQRFVKDEKAKIGMLLTSLISIDSGATTHINVIIQGCLNYR